MAPAAQMPGPLLDVLSAFLGGHGQALRGASIYTAKNYLPIVEQLMEKTRLANATQKLLVATQKKLAAAEHCLEMRHRRDHEKDDEIDAADIDWSCTVCGRRGGGNFYEVEPEDRIICSTCFDVEPVEHVVTGMLK